MIKCFMKSTHRKKVEQGHPYWIGKVYNYVSYKYDIPCSKLIDLITVDDMLKQYVTMHETGLEHTAQQLYEVFIIKRGQASLTKG